MEGPPLGSSSLASDNLKVRQTRSHVHNRREGLL